MTTHYQVGWNWIRVRRARIAGMLRRRSWRGGYLGELLAELSDALPAAGIGADELKRIDSALVARNGWSFEVDGCRYWIDPGVATEDSPASPARSVTT